MRPLILETMLGVKKTPAVMLRGEGAGCLDPNRLGGNAVTKVMVFGRIAGTTIVNG